MTGNKFSTSKSSSHVKVSSKACLAKQHSVKAQKLMFLVSILEQLVCSGNSQRLQFSGISVRLGNSQQLPGINCQEITRGLQHRVFLLTEFQSEFHVWLPYSYLQRDTELSSSKAAEPRWKLTGFKGKVNSYFLLPTGLPTDSAGILALPAGRSE